MKDFEQLVMKDMCKSFGDLHVLRDFNLTINRGEFITFLGPSGCGKSTALNCISGLINITSGTIKVDNTVLDDGKKTFVSPEKRGFGIIFQNYALFPHMSVYDNIAFSMNVAHKPKDEIAKRVAEAIRMVHLEGQEHKFPSQLSGGQQQRVAIARSVVMEPSLLLLDEPLSNLDTKLRIEMRYELKQIHNRLERASIYVTHDQSEALALSDRIVILKLGKMQQIGTPKEVYLHPVNRFVADFMGYKNIWECMITSINDVDGNHVYHVAAEGTEFVVVEKIGENAANEKKLADSFAANEPVLLAIRPDDIQFGKSAHNTISTTVTDIEYLGTANQINCKFGGLNLQARIDPSESIYEDGEISLHVAPERMILLPKDKEE